MSNNHRRAVLRLLALTIALLCPSHALFAAETGPEIVPPSDNAPTARDMQVVLRIRRALKADQTLGQQNVGVIVRDGVATLWGPLESGEEVRHAVKTVQQVRGVMSVRSDLYVVKSTKPLFILPGSLAPEQSAPSDALAFGGPRSFLTNWNRMPLSLPGMEVVAPAKSSAGALSGPALGDPLPSEATTVTSARAEAVPAAIERLQKTDARFGFIAVTFSDGTVVLRGNRNEASTVMAFARLLSDVPGVERIVVQNPKKP